MENPSDPSAASSFEEYRETGIMVGRRGGPLDIVETLFWHDCPVVFLSRDRAGATFLTVLIEDDRDRRTMEHVLIVVDDAEIAALGSETKPGDHNRIGEAAIRRAGGADLVRTSWDTGWGVVEERRLGAEEAVDAAIVPERPERGDGA